MMGGWVDVSGPLWRVLGELNRLRTTPYVLPKPQHPVTPEEVLHAHPELYPFKTYHKRHELVHEPFAAIFILHDPVQWAEEIQARGTNGWMGILCLGRGIMGVGWVGRSTPCMNDGRSSTNQP